MSNQTLTRRATGATWWSALEIGARYGTQFGVTLVLARLLTPADFGLVAMLTVFTTVGELMINFGLGSALIQRQRTSADEQFTVFAFSISVSAAVVLVLWAVAPAIADFYRQPPLVALLRWMSLALPLAAIAIVPDALLTSRLDFKRRTRAEVVASLCAGATAILLAHRGWGVTSIALQLLMGASLRSAFLWAYSGWVPRGAFRWKVLTDLARFAGFLFLNALLDAAFVRIQSLLLGRLSDARTLGLYAIAQNTQQAPASLLGGVLTRVGLPVFSSVSTQPEKLLGALRLSQRAAMFLFAPCMFGIALVAKPLIATLYGPGWVEAAPILSILAVATAFWPMILLNTAALSATGNSKMVLKVGVVQKCVGIALIVISAPSGAVAVAWSALAATAVTVAMNADLARRTVNYALRKQGSDQIGTLALSCLAALAGWAVLHWTRASLGTFIASIVLGAVVYLGCAWLTRSKALFELLDLARTLRPARPTDQAA
jgi:O-antigen/teichoic acid export membrane protein